MNAQRHADNAGCSHRGGVATERSGYLSDFCFEDIPQAVPNSHRLLCCPRLVCLFLKRGADYNAKDKNQKDPITIAVDNANADIVTL